MSPALALLLALSQPSPSPSSSSPEGPPGVAFAVESSVVVRAAPSDAAAAVVEVPIWTAVAVGPPGAAAGWLRVTVGPRTLRYDAPGGEARPVAPARFDGPTGYVHASAVDARPPSRVALLALAAQKDAQDEPARRVLLARAFALDPGDDDVKRALSADARGAALRPVSRRRHSPFARADLVFGCRGDLARARVVGGLLGREPPDPDACIAHIDTRAPCGRDGSIDTVDAARKKTAVAHTVARFGKDGPALRLVPLPGASDRPIYVVTRLLAGEGCNADGNGVAAVTDLQLDRLRVPAVAPPSSSSAAYTVVTTLHVLVPRYAGALYDVVGADGPDDLDLDREPVVLGPDFDVDPRDDPPAGDHFFVAPEVCCAAADDEP